jgi:hypothetical protein
MPKNDAMAGATSSLNAAMHPQQWVAPAPLPPTIQLPVQPTQPTQQQNILNDMLSGSAYDPYREQTQEAQARYERDTRASGAAIANQRGFAGQGIGDQLANATESDLARQRFDTAIKLDIGEQATKERGAAIAMDQAWQALSWASQYGSDADFAKAYQEATGKAIDPMAVSQYRGYARTLAEQQIASNAANLESGETNQLTGYITAAKGADANWDWTSDAAAVKGIAEEYKRRTGKEFNINDPTAKAWADNFVKMTATDPVTSTLNSMRGADWYKAMDPISRAQLDNAVVTAGMAATAGMTFELDSSGQIVAARYPDGDLLWSRKGYQSPSDQAAATFQTDYAAAYPNGPAFDQATYDAIEEELGKAPTPQEYAQMAPGMADNVAFNTFSEQYSAKYGTAKVPDREIYDKVSEAIGQAPSAEEYRKYEMLADPLTAGTVDIGKVKGDAVAVKLLTQNSPVMDMLDTVLKGSDSHGTSNFADKPPKGSYFVYDGKLYQCLDSVAEEDARGGRNTFNFPAMLINSDGTTTKKWIATTQTGRIYVRDDHPDY